MKSQIILQNLEKKKAIGLIHRVYLSLLKNSRDHLASTKTRSEIRGGGRKPWKQKGTGNARAGSIRSPLWAGGGVIFGPKPKTVQKKINKKERRLAILSAFFLKTSRLIKVNDDFFNKLEITKTNHIVKFLIKKNLFDRKKILFILPDLNKNFWLAIRNLKNIESTTANCLNLSQLLEAEHIIISDLSFEIINQIYGKK